MCFEGGRLLFSRCHSRWLSTLLGCVVFLFCFLRGGALVSVTAKKYHDQKKLTEDAYGSWGRVHNKSGGVVAGSQTRKQKVN